MPASTSFRFLHRGLAEAGYTDGRNVAVDYVWAEGLYDRRPTLARGINEVMRLPLFWPGSFDRD